MGGVADDITVHSPFPVPAQYATVLGGLHAQAKWRTAGVKMQQK